jgi:hypothetical protein
VTHDFSWRPGIGDPTIVGWIITVLYLLACLSCWKTSGLFLRRDWRSQSDTCFWIAISVAFFVLGLNKQLDLQSALTELGRIVALTAGWYEQRRTVQVYFVVAVAILCMATTMALFFWNRNANSQVRLAIGGCTSVLGYDLIRAASFHHVDNFIDAHIFGFTWNWMLEMSGIVVVLLASGWRLAEVVRQLKRPVT